VETAAVSNLDDFLALNPFFRIIEEESAVRSVHTAIVVRA
jgi:hypothetical protein